MREDEKKGALKPKLRFPEFRDGKRWQEKVLKEICEINPQNEGLPDSFIYIDLESVEAGVLRSRNRIVKSQAPSRAQRLLKNGDVVFQIVRPYQRNNLFVQFPDTEAYVASTGYAQLRANENESFLYHVVHTDSFVTSVIAKCTGSSYPAINSSDLREVRVCVPPTLQEQQKIADCLTLLDKVISTQARKVETLKTRKKGLVQQLFPREGETMPRLRLLEFKRNKKWRTKKMSGLLNKASSPVSVDPELTYREIGIRSHGKGIFHKDAIAGKVLGNKRVFHVVKNAFVVNIVFAWEHAVATTSEAEEGMIASHRFPMYVPKSEQCDVRYIKWFFLTTWGKHLLGLASPGGAGRNKTLGQKEFERLQIPLPETVAEQASIADCLDAAEELIACEVQKLDVLKTHRMGLLQQLFPSPVTVET